MAFSAPLRHGSCASGSGVGSYVQSERSASWIDWASSWLIPGTLARSSTPAFFTSCKPKTDEIARQRARTLEMEKDLMR